MAHSQTTPVQHLMDDVYVYIETAIHKYSDSDTVCLYIHVKCSNCKYLLEWMLQFRLENIMHLSRVRYAYNIYLYKYNVLYVCVWVPIVFE